MCVFAHTDISDSCHSHLPHSMNKENSLNQLHTSNIFASCIRNFILAISPIEPRVEIHGIPLSLKTINNFK